MFKLPFWPQKSIPETNQKSDPQNVIRAMVGLGNPGEKYKKTYHNVGSSYIDYLAQKNDLHFKTYKNFEYVKLDDLILLKTLSFMNLSGEVISKAIKHFGLKPNELVVAHDDSDLYLGEYKVVFGRGSAGHKGVESISRHLKTKDFWRIRIGIRKRPGRAGDFVLKEIGGDDLNALKALFAKIELPDL